MVNERRLTEADIEVINKTINKGYRVEVIPIKDGVMLIEIRREQIETRRKLNNTPPFKS